MKNDAQKIILALVALATVSIAPALVRADADLGNGDGHNGPTLSPISVPGADERGVAEKVVLQAVRTCLITGAPDRGVTSLLQKEGKRVFAIPFVEVEENAHERWSAYWSRLSDYLTPGWWSPLRRFGGIAGPKASSLILTAAFETKNSLGIPQYTDSDTYTVTFIPELTDAAGSAYYPNALKFEEERKNYSTRKQVLSHGEMTLDFPDHVMLPQIRWQKRETVSDYDDFNEPYNTRDYLQGIGIEMDAIQQATLIDRASGKQAPVTVDLAAYASCLVTEVQRNGAP